MYGTSTTKKLFLKSLKSRYVLSLELEIPYRLVDA